MKQNWPTRIWIVRHAENAGNVAGDAAEVAGSAQIEIVERDEDVPLTALGERQVEALGTWFGGMLLPEQPVVGQVNRASRPSPWHSVNL